MSLFNPEVIVLHKDGKERRQFSMLEPGDKVLARTGTIVKIGAVPELVQDPDLTYVVYDAANSSWFPEEFASYGCMAH